MSTFDCPLLGGLSSFGVSLIRGFTVCVFPIVFGVWGNLSQLAIN